MRMNVVFMCAESVHPSRRLDPADGEPALWRHLHFVDGEFQGNGLYEVEFESIRDEVNNKCRHLVALRFESGIMDSKREALVVSGAGQRRQSWVDLGDAICQFGRPGGRYGSAMIVEASVVPLRKSRVPATDLRGWITLGAWSLTAQGMGQPPYDIVVVPVGTWVRKPRWERLDGGGAIVVSDERLDNVEVLGEAERELGPVTPASVPYPYDEAEAYFDVFGRPE